MGLTNTYCRYIKVAQIHIVQVRLDIRNAGK